MAICLTVDELREITGFKKYSAQLRYLRQQGFKVMARADGKPVISRTHFEQVMGVKLPSSASEFEPDYGALI
jgi:hypothetical protein